MATKEEVINNLKQSLAEIDNPDEPIFGTEDGETLSARQILKEIEDGTELGKLFLAQALMLAVHEETTK